MEMTLTILTTEKVGRSPLNGSSREEIVEAFAGAQFGMESDRGIVLVTINNSILFQADDVLMTDDWTIDGVIMGISTAVEEW